MTALYPYAHALPVVGRILGRAEEDAMNEGLGARQLETDLLDLRQLEAVRARASTLGSDGVLALADLIRDDLPFGMS